MTIRIYELCGADPELLFSPHCWKTRMSVAHKGLDYQTVSVPFTGVATVEDGENRRVPVLRDGDTVVEESLEIARYLDKTYPDAPALLGGSEAEALTQFVIQWSQNVVHPEVVKVCLMDIYNALAPEDQAHFRTTREKLFGRTLEEFSAKFDKSGDGMAKALKPLEALLGQQDYLGGDKPMFADYVVFGPLQWARTCSTTPIVPTEGKVADWFNRLLDMHDGVGRNAKTAA